METGSDGVKYSGAPGYLKGMPLLVGSTDKTKEDSPINYNPSGFALRGANNKGECYFVNKNKVSQTFDVATDTETTETMRQIVGKSDSKVRFLEDKILMETI